MSDKTRRSIVVIAIVILLIIIALLAIRCNRETPVTSAREAAGTTAGATAAQGSAGAVSPASVPDEILTPATLSAVKQVAAGAEFVVAWTGPENPEDFVTIVPTAAPPAEHGNYRQVKRGIPLKLTAPMEPGSYELRYLAARSRAILGRAPIEVLPVAATLSADDEVMLGASFSVGWTGPDNSGDYVTIVPKDAPDEAYGNYTNTQSGTPLKLTAPATAGDAELRYVAAQGRKVLARRPIRVVLPDVSVRAPDDAIAGSTIQVEWTGPNNAGDYITVVVRATPDGQYGNYTNTSNGSPLKLLLPIMSGDAELRYMTGQGNKVLARRAIRVAAAEVKLSAAAECAPGADVQVTWSGPNHGDDYITIVRKETPDGQYAAYTPTSGGSPLSVAAPKEPGDAEIRYMTGQGSKVLARVPIRVSQ